MATIAKQITVSQGDPPDRNVYRIKEIQGAISFDIASTGRKDVRVGDKLSFNELNNYLNSPNVDVLVITTE